MLDAGRLRSSWPSLSRPFTSFDHTDRHVVDGRRKAGHGGNCDIRRPCLVDRRHGHELAVLDRQQIDRLLDVVSIHHGLARQRAVKFADCQECLAQRVAGRRLFLVEDMFVQLGSNQNRVIVVLQIRQPVRRPLDLGIPPFQERRQVLVVIKPRCKRGDDEAFRRRSKRAASGCTRRNRRRHAVSGPTAASAR